MYFECRAKIDIRLDWILGEKKDASKSKVFSLSSRKIELPLTENYRLDRFG
jgi:hypothetical protein